MENKARKKYSGSPGPGWCASYNSQWHLRSLPEPLELCRCKARLEQEWVVREEACPVCLKIIAHQWLPTVSRAALFVCSVIFPGALWITSRLECTPVSLASLQLGLATWLRCPVHFLQVGLPQWPLPGDPKATGEQPEFAYGHRAHENLQARILLLLP